MNEGPELKAKLTMHIPCVDHRGPYSFLILFFVSPCFCNLWWWSALVLISAFTCFFPSWYIYWLLPCSWKEADSVPCLSLTPRCPPSLLASYTPPTQHSFSVWVSVNLSPPDPSSHFFFLCTLLPTFHINWILLFLGLRWTWLPWTGCSGPTCHIFSSLSPWVRVS